MTLTLLLAAAWAEPDTELELYLGGRTAPEASIQLPRHWENELEPTLVPALIAHWRWAGEAGGWTRVRLGLWGSAPEEDANLLEVGPRLGLARSHAGWRLDLALAYDLQVYAILPEATNGRWEGYGRVSRSLGGQDLALEARALHRTYPLQLSWGFQSVEAGPSWAATLAGGLRASAEASLQANAGYVLSAATDPVRATGRQLRGHLELGYGAGRWDLRAGYRPILAWGGLSDEGARPQFTPKGEYTDDADALSAGGFVQHRLDVGAVWGREAWTFHARALGRMRLGAPTEAQTLTRTLHGSLGADRDLGPGLLAVAEVGASRVLLSDGASYLDLSGWVGLRWRSPPDGGGR